MAHIEIVPASGRVVVRWRGQVVLDTKAALQLKEGASPPVFYLPRADANLSLFQASPRKTICPYKGEASYFHLGEDQNAVWSYETPKAGVEAIAGHLAFYANKVDISHEPS